MTMQEIADKQALYELMCHYCMAIDRKQFDRLHGLYSPGAWHDHGAMFEGSAESFIAFVKTRMTNMTTQHMIGNHFYRIDGDRAEGEIYSVNYHIFHDSEPQQMYVAGGRYHDHYLREDGQWRISKRLRRIDWSWNGSPSSGELSPAGVSNADDAAFLQALLGGG